MKLNELETFFNSVDLPTEPIKLNQCTTIIDVQKFVRINLMTLKAQKGNKAFMPYYHSLVELYKILKK